MTYIYEKNKEENSNVPLFLFNVTMQNHGGYDEENEVDITVKPENEEFQILPMNMYLSLVRESDRAFEQLINYFQNVERDVIVLMFGDHQPRMDTELFGDGTKITQQRKFQTNFIIWANFDIDEREGMFISPNYLSSILMETAGVELSDWNRFLLKVMEEFPAISTIGYLDSEGDWNYEVNEEELLQLYSQIQYYNAFDFKNLKVEYFE